MDLYFEDKRSYKKLSNGIGRFTICSPLGRSIGRSRSMYKVIGD